ncbi:hypothetical protein [Thiolapillus sp.]
MLTPAQAGVQLSQQVMDSGLGNCSCITPAPPILGFLCWNGNFLDARVIDGRAVIAVLPDIASLISKVLLMSY